LTCGDSPAKLCPHLIQGRAAKQRSYIPDEAVNVILCSGEQAGSRDRVTGDVTAVGRRNAAALALDLRPGDGGKRRYDERHRASVATLVLCLALLHGDTELAFWRVL
jgi:hypothetical protein